MPTQSQVKKLFDYIDGELFRKGKVAGYIRPDGYRSIAIQRKQYFAHRLIFLYHRGYLPEIIDHIDCDVSNNNIENLRPATKQQNAMNTKIKKTNKSGIKGVHFCNTYNLWVARLRYSGKHITIGKFTCKHEAEKSLVTKRKELHGDYANNG